MGGSAGNRRETNNYLRVLILSSDHWVDLAANLEPGYQEFHPKVRLYGAKSDMHVGGNAPVFNIQTLQGYQF